MIPARDAAATLPEVLARLPIRQLRSVVVVDHASRDATSAIARDAGALVLREPSGGYGAACLHAIAHLSSLPEPPGVVAFVPGDGRADSADLGAVVQPILDGSAELAIGVRTREQGPPIAERVAVGLIRAVYRHRFRDLGPMRAVRFPALVALGMSDRGGGWDVEMQVRALKLGLAIAEVPVGTTASPRSRGAATAAAAAGTRSLFHILRHATMR
ncbi:MAG TPA: glycosyltransferase [Kofleriaceae bacterium]|nr:glycosyltransferase [Kofleriaceae bacterium]